MGRRLAEAANAWRTRRTRGDTGLRRFFWLVLLGVVFLGLVFFTLVWVWLFWPAVARCAEDFAGLADAFGDDGEDGGGVDCPAADCHKPNSKRKIVPAKNQTTKRRTKAYLLPEIGTHNL